MNIRNATAKDIPGIAALSRRFTEEVPTWGQVALTEEQVRKLDRRLIWVAEENNEITGYAIWQPRPRDDGVVFNKSDKILTLDEIYLVPEAHGKGVGSALMNAIANYVKKEGCTKLHVYSSVKDLLPAIGFYRRNGFQTWGIELFKEVGSNMPGKPGLEALSITNKLLEAPDIPRIISAFSNSEWRTPASYFEKLLVEQLKGERVFLMALYGKDVAGFVTIKWQAGYPPFAEKGIPEIRDLRVLAAFRRRGIATALMDEAEKRIFERAETVGLGVGLYADYGNAQRLYVLRGYIPDGRGLTHQNQPVKPGNDVFVDDDLVLYFTKERRQRIVYVQSM